MPPLRRRPQLDPLRLAVGAAMAVAWLVAGADPAAAQVEATGRPEGPGTTAVAFTADGGCGGAPTTGLLVRLPDGTAEVAPQPPPGWTVRYSGTDLEWTSGPVDGAQPVVFTATMRLPGMIGDVVYLPTVQSCGPVRQAWTEPTPDAAAAHAAPRVVLEVSYLPKPATPAAGGPEQTKPPTPARSAEATTVATVAPAGASAVPALAGVLIVGLAAAVLGTALVARRSPGGGG
jgi:hypothetical protein